MNVGPGSGGGGGGGGYTTTVAGNGGSGIIIIRWLTSFSNSAINLISGITNNTDFKVGNYNGDFKIKTSITGTDTDRFTMTSVGNINVNNSMIINNNLQISGILNANGGITTNGVSSFGTNGPLIIDPNYSTNNYIQMYDDVRVQGVFSTTGNCNVGSLNNITVSDFLRASQNVFFSKTDYCRFEYIHYPSLCLTVLFCVCTLV